MKKVSKQPSQSAVNSSSLNTVYPNKSNSNITSLKRTPGKVSISSIKTDEKTAHLPTEPVSVAKLRTYDLSQLGKLKFHEQIIDKL